MEENVAISKKKQKSFQSSVDNYKKLLKAGKIEIKENEPTNKEGKSTKNRGIVYLSNIPHGFYEDEIKQYFKQFGAVSRVRLARSKNSGRSKGYAFIEFKVPDVAEIVAETMNNYLMCKRLLKAKYIPPEEQHDFYFKGKNWTEKSYPKLRNRKQNVQLNHSEKTDKEVMQTAKKLLKGVDKVKKKLLEIGIVYNFVPVDIPQELQLNKNEDTTASESESEIESENDTPTLFAHESDDSDVFNASPSYKTVVPKNNPTKTKKLKKSVKSKTLKTDFTSNKKLQGVSKKNNVKKTKANLDKDSAKMKLIQKNILNDNQVSIKTMNDIKKKKSRK